VRDAVTSGRRAWAAVLSSLNPSAEDAWLTDAQLRLFRDGTRNSALTLAVGSFFVSQICAPWVEPRVRMTWWIAVTAIGIALHLIGLDLDQNANASLASIRLRAWSCLGITVTVLLAWASMSVFLWAPDQPLEDLLLIFILACSLAGSIAVAAAHPAISLAAFAINIVFIVGPLFGSRLNESLAWLACLFGLLMASQLVAMNRTVTKMLRLEHERAALVEDLTRAKTESDRDREHALAAGRARSQFLSSMSHELRTPMNAILGFSELIRNRPPGMGIEQYSEYGGIVHESGQQLLQLIDGILDLSRIEAGRFSLKEAEFDPAILFEDVFEACRARADAAGISFSLRVARALPLLRADQRAIRQIAINLLSNAFRFTAKGGSVALFAMVEADGGLAFGVEDTGIGIAPAEQADIFERFGRGRHDVTTAGHGVGLGLAIVKGFAEAHDGAIVVESTPGAGTCIAVRLPAARLCAPAPLRAAS